MTSNNWPIRDCLLKVQRRLNSNLFCEIQGLKESSKKAELGSNTKSPSTKFGTPCWPEVKRRSQTKPIWFIQVCDFLVKYRISLTNQVIKYCSTGNCVKLGQTWIHSDSKTNPVHQKTFFIIKRLGWASAYIKQIISKGSISGWPGRTQYTNTNMKYKNNWSPGQYTNIKSSQIQIQI